MPGLGSAGKFYFLSLLVKQLGPWIRWIFRGNHEVHRVNKSLKQLRFAFLPYLSICLQLRQQGRSQTFSFGGATGGASFATRGAVNGLCRTSMQWHDVTRKIWGATGGARKNFWGAVAPPGTPLAPPLCGRYFAGNHCLRIEEFFFLWQRKSIRRCFRQALLGCSML